MVTYTPYSSYINEISPDELFEGLLGYGLFSDKIPPFLSSVQFFEHQNAHPIKPSRNRGKYIYYESIRDTNVPRQHGIPNPFLYCKLCKCLSDNWPRIQSHFQNNTQAQAYKISRIHIRKIANSRVLFKMNYKNWKDDPSPEPDFLIGKRWQISADISTCFPSIYTHSLPWALVGKESAKSRTNKTYWFNRIDSCARSLTDGETHGVLIGPHASNLLSEIVLVVIDNNLYSQGWEFVRYIDDYTCYTNTYEKGQEFLCALSRELRDFGLVLNSKKSKVQQLPLAATKQWTRQLKSLEYLIEKDVVSYKHVQSYLDQVIEIMACNNNESSILNYALRMLAKRQLSKNAKDYCAKTVLHYSIIYPYLVPFLDELLVIPFGITSDLLEQPLQEVFTNNIKGRNFEAASYAIYLSMKYGCALSELNSDSVINSGDCILMLSGYLYFLHNNLADQVNNMKAYAVELASDNDGFERNWLFFYEVLDSTHLDKEWKELKDAGVSFIDTSAFISSV